MASCSVGRVGGRSRGNDMLVKRLLIKHVLWPVSHMFTSPHRLTGPGGRCQPSTSPLVVCGESLNLSVKLSFPSKYGLAQHLPQRVLRAGQEAPLSNQHHWS